VQGFVCWPHIYSVSIYSTEQVSQAKKAEENLVLQIVMLVMDSKRAKLLSLTETNALLHVPKNRNKDIQENDKV